MTGLWVPPVRDVRGIGRAKRAVCAYLEEDLPSRAVECATAWGLDAEDSVAAWVPQVYLPHVPQALDRWPMLAVTSVRTTYGRVENGADGPEYATVHGLRLFLWVRASRWENVEPVRDDAAAVVMTSLLDQQQFEHEGAWCLVAENSLSASYSEVTPVHGDRFVAAVQLDFSMQVEESLTRRGLGTMDSVTVLGEPASEIVADYVIHPALADD